VGCDSGSDFNGGIVGVGGIVQWRIVGKDGIIVEVMEVVGVEGSRVLFERYLPLHDTVLTPPSPKTRPDLERDERAGFSGSGLCASHVRSVDSSRRATDGGLL